MDSNISKNSEVMEDIKEYLYIYIYILQFRTFLSLTCDEGVLRLPALVAECRPKYREMPENKESL